MITYEFLEDEAFLNLRCIFSKYSQLGVDGHYKDMRKLNWRGKLVLFSRCACMALQLSLFALWKFGILYVKKREQKKMAEEDLES